MYSQILESFNFKDENVLNIYPYGSRVYGTASPDSDYDFVVILSKLETDSDRMDAHNKPISITVYLPETFKARIAEHKIGPLECIFCPKDQIIKSTIDIPFKLNKSKLRESISEKCSKDWNQAKKRFSDSQGINPVTGQPYLRKIYEGKKSLFHCFRMMDFATQIINHGSIINFSSCNNLWEEIITNPSEDWNHYKETYHKLFNSQMTEFRKIAPK